MRRDMRVMRNEKPIGNDEYIKLLDMMIKSMELTELILESFDNDEIENSESQEYEGMTRDEIISLRFIDELSTFNIRELNYVMKGVGEGFYFSKRMNILFMNTLEELKFELIKLEDKVNYSLDINFKSEHEQSFKAIYKNINYCVLSGFGLFYLRDSNEIQDCVMEYSIKTDTDIEELAESMIEYYRLHRPNMPMLTKYPELLEKLEDFIPDEFFFDIVDLSSMMKVEEMKDIINGELEITDSYIELLEYRLSGEADE